MCVFPMVIWPAFRMVQYRVNDHPYHAPQFSLYFGRFNYFQDFMGRRPLPVRNYVASIKYRPWMLNHVSKVRRLLLWQYKTENSPFHLRLYVSLSSFPFKVPGRKQPTPINPESLNLSKPILYKML